MNILGISCFYHDSAAALIRDGRLIAAAEEERFSRKKHDSEFPERAVQFCLDTAGISINEVDHVVFYEKPFLKFERILMSSLATYPLSYKVFRESMITWLLDKLWVKTIIRDKLGIETEKIFFAEHHLSHAASSFFCSPFEEAAILTTDGVGEWTTTSCGRGKGLEINLTREIKFPHSLGLLYSAFTAFLGFRVNNGEYKVMGMAAYGKPRHVDKVYQLINVEEDGGFRLNMEYFSFHHSLTRTYNNKFLELFGDPRNPSDSDTPEPYYADIAASIQTVTEEVLLKIARSLQKETGLKKLCIAGGVGLNSVANWRLLNETGFEDIYIQPASGDSGCAIGACLYFYHAVLGKPRNFVMKHAYWGKEFSDDDIRTALKLDGAAYERIDNDDALIDAAADLLVSGKVIGWYQGRFEWGPRALGNRSILADPRRAEMKNTINKKIKFREPFRPFAPSVLAEHAEEYFLLDRAQEHYPARFMLMVPPVREEKRSQIPAVTHVDGTGRMQMVYHETNPRYYSLIRRFKEKTGVPVILNTSFNLRGEPIVASPADALLTFNRSDMDALIMKNFIVRKGSK
ncbi:MAG: carbamoyltransferase [Candidatus Omnitrophota bacterium]